MNHRRFAKFAKLSCYTLYLFRVQKYSLKQLVEGTHKLVAEAHKYFHSNCVTCTSFTCDSCQLEYRLINQLLGAPFFSLMADKCTDVATIEELSSFCHWVENGSPVKHFIEILGLKNESIYSVLINWLNTKNVQSHRLVQQIVDVWNRKPRIVAV